MSIRKWLIVIALIAIPLSLQPRLILSGPARGLWVFGPARSAAALYTLEGGVEFIVWYDAQRCLMLFGGRKDTDGWFYMTRYDANGKGW